MMKDQFSSRQEKRKYDRDVLLPAYKEAISSFFNKLMLVGKEEDPTVILKEVSQKTDDFIKYLISMKPMHIKVIEQAAETVATNFKERMLKCLKK